MEDENLEECIMTECRLSTSSKKRLYIKAGVRAVRVFNLHAVGRRSRLGQDFMATTDLSLVSKQDSKHRYKAYHHLVLSLCLYALA